LGKGSLAVGLKGSFMVRLRLNVLLFSTTAALLLWGGGGPVYGQQIRVSSGATSIEKTIGVVSLNPSGYKKDSQLRFFNKDGSLWYQYSFYGDAGVPVAARGDFKPFAFHADYFVLVVKCVKRHVNRWEVIVNEATGLTKFVRVEDRNLKFETWGGHILKLFAVDFDQSINPVRTLPSGRGNQVGLADRLIYRPVQIKGIWLKVRAESPENGKGRSVVRMGWIKWRDEKDLLIEPFYFA
jgi:hypothetical protein